MPRILNASQVAHVTYYDSLFRNIGTTSVQSGLTLFQQNGSGNRDITNMKTPGALPGDQVLLIKALRIAVQFESLSNSEWTAAYGSFAALLANTVATGLRAFLCYAQALYGSYATLEVGSKPYLLCPAWFLPAGGGLAGFTSETTETLASNGNPASSSTLRFALPVQVSARQPFAVKIDWFNFRRSGNGVGAAGGALGADLDPLAFVNNFDGLKIYQVHAEGLETRDVE